MVQSSQVEQAFGLKQRYFFRLEKKLSKISRDGTTHFIFWQKPSGTRLTADWDHPAKRVFNG
jgi:hypothetical protein